MIHIPRWQSILVLIIVVVGILGALPNVFNESTLRGLPDWVPSQKVNLGLDLRGGSHVLLEVETNAVVRQRLQSIVSDVRTALRREKPRINYRGLGVRGNTVAFTVLKSEDVSRARSAIFETATGATIETDGNRIAIVLTDATLRDIQNSAISQSIEIVRKRIDETGTREPTIQRQGLDRIIIQLPGVDDPARIIALLGQTAKMTFHLVDTSMLPQQAQAGRPPPGSMLLPSDSDRDLNDNPIMYLVRKKVEVSGENLVDAQGTFQDNQPVVSFRFDNLGARKFGNITRRNVGRPFAIVLDGKVISAPVIREPILGGSGVISGNFTVQSANDLALLLRAGALPAPIKPLEQRSVGASLGADSIRAGEIASVGAIVLVIIFMFAAYGRFGAMADIALITNMILIMAALSILQATLTLPGIAGIVLTIGMAVDANVLIFERIREEQRNGRTPISAVDAGFQRALGTIVDANVTTLLAAILLYSFGSGPIRGFAVTLAIGLVTSMFTAIMVTRLMVVFWLLKRRPERLPL